MANIPRRTVRNEHRSQVGGTLRQAVTGPDATANQGLWLGTSTSVINLATGVTGYPPPLTYSSGWLTTTYDSGTGPRFDTTAAVTAPRFLPTAGIWRVSIQMTYLDTATAGGRRTSRLMNVSGGPTEVGRFWATNIGVAPTNPISYTGVLTVRTDGQTWYAIEASWTGTGGPIDVRLDQTTWQQLAALRAKPI